MSKITRLARGLQEYLGTQNQGSNPVDLGQVVTPTVNFDLFYQVEKRFWEAAAFSPTAIDTVKTLVTIPDDEIWGLYRVSIRISWAGTTVGDSVRPSVTVANLPNISLATQTVPIASFGTVTQTAGTITNNTVSANTLLWGGTDVFFEIRDLQITAGAINGTVFAEYLRLKF